MSQVVPETHTMWWPHNVKFMRGMVTNSGMWDNKNCSYAICHEVVWGGRRVYVQTQLLLTFGTRQK
jgi:hypothetical protein